jgi:endonuclease YncB( thermonuclease family)
MLYRMRLGVQRYLRWTSTGSRWHWAAGLGSPILVLLIVIGALHGEVKEQSSGDGAFAPSLFGPPPTVQPIATSLTLTGSSGLVVRVIDGDTVEIDGGPDGRTTVRYIGIDAPEAGAAGQPVGCYGREASNRNRELVEGKTVLLEKDVSETDQVGRLLRYVFLETGQMVNELLVAEGFARASSSPPDLRHQDRFMAAQQQARDAGRGLWGPACRPTATPVTPRVAPTLPPSPTTAPPSGNCSPAYPTVCIPPPPPDLDCRQIPFRRFEVLPPDPHRFDPESDGIGCEMG